MAMGGCRQRESREGGIGSGSWWRWDLWGLALLHWGLGEEELSMAPCSPYKDWCYPEIRRSKGEQVRCGGEEKVMNSIFGHLDRLSFCEIPFKWRCLGASYKFEILS